MAPPATPRSVPTFSGEVGAERLGVTLIHEHVFVRHPELDVNLPHPEWHTGRAIETAVEGLSALYERGVRTIVDLTVPGLGRDVELVARVAERSRVAIVASTGYYTSDVLPHFFRTHGPDRLVGGPDPLLGMFVRDIEEGIAGTGIRAGMIKVVSDVEGITLDVERVFAAAATAHLRTGVPITTHSHAASAGGRDQQRLLARFGVPLDRVVIGHSGDSTDLAYLRELADKGSFLGFDRFGMEHVALDDDRIRTLVTLLREGYAERIVLSHDAAFFSRVTPPSWRARAVPHWHMQNIHTRVLPRLRAAGIDERTIDTLLVDNPRRVLTGAA